MLHGMYLRIVIPPPPNAAWEIGFTLRTFQDTAEMFDFPEAGRLAEEILRNTFATLEQQTQPGHDTSTPMTQYKGADLGPYDIDVPTMYAPPAYRHRLRPPHDGTMQWLMDLGQICVNSAEDEAFEDEPLLYVQAWFINHEQFRSCRDPRPMIDDFRHLWNDRLDGRRNFSLHVVRPRPPQPRYHNYACHVLVEQAITPTRSAVVLTALIDGDRRDGFFQGAFSTTHVVRQHDLIDPTCLQPYWQNDTPCASPETSCPLHSLHAIATAGRQTQDASWSSTPFVSCISQMEGKDGSAHRTHLFRPYRSVL